MTYLYFFGHINASTYLTKSILETNKTSFAKGQLISKCLFGVFNFFQETNENKSHSSKNEFKTNSFIHSLEEFTAWQFAFEIIWPLALFIETIELVKLNLRAPDVYLAPI